MGQVNFEASNGWLEKFKGKRNIAFKRLHGEAGSVDANSVATWKGFVMDEAMEEVVEEMNRCFEALKKHQAIDVNYIDFLEVDKDVQVAGEQSIEEIVKEVMGKEEDEEDISRLDFYATTGEEAGSIPIQKKSKIDSVEQEETTMTIKKEATNQYERVAKHNQWDETLCLANVYFYLTGTALKWFENNEESILIWTEFMSQLKSVFGKNENLRL
ncbi:PDC2 [Cordylochernes scorpioides]|uniref:PDC2 n=1 Tax=Cordylochernes scorpioides TaxID=51811 RepID=A0ABY6LLT4_9ARAC|nr:PDC2 [Cordylochernes scorpioides]